MKESMIDREGAIIAHHQPPEVSQPGDSALDDPAPSVPPQGASVLRGWPYPIPLVRADQLDAALPQALSQRIAVVGFVGNNAHRLLPRSACTVAPPYADGRQRGLREPDFCRGCRVKLVSQRNTLAVDHHHPLRPLATLGFSDSAAPFFAGAKLPSRNDSLQFNCWRWFNSLRNARQIVSQTSCCSQSRSRRQQVAGEGNSSGKSCHRAPLRKIHKIPSSTLRLSARGRPPCGRFGDFGSKGRIFSHWASVNRRPYRAIDPPSALLPSVITHPDRINYCKIRSLYPVLKQLLE